VTFFSDFDEVKNIKKQTYLSNQEIDTSTRLFLLFSKVPPRFISATDFPPCRGHLALEMLLLLIRPLSLSEWMVLVMRRRALRLSLRLLQAKVSWLTVVMFNQVGTKLSVSLRVKMVIVEKKLEV